MCIHIPKYSSYPYDRTKGKLLTEIQKSQLKLPVVTELVNTAARVHMYLSLPP